MIANNGIITLMRGDSFTTPIYINLGSKLSPNIYKLKEGDSLYFGLMEPKQAFVDAILKKKFDFTSPTDEEGNILLKIYPEDTLQLLVGKYYYMIKLKQPGPDEKDIVTTIVPPTQFFLNGGNETQDICGGSIEYEPETVVTIIDTEIEKHNTSDTAHNDIRLSIKELSSQIPTKTSELTNDSGFLTEHQSLAQTTGQSETMVMSQKATTDEINNLKNELDNKLPKSPNDWEEWTDDEQTAAQEKMGIPIISDGQIKSKIGAKSFRTGNYTLTYSAATQNNITLVDEYQLAVQTTALTDTTNKANYTIRIENHVDEYGAYQLIVFKDSVQLYFVDCYTLADVDKKLKLFGLELNGAVTTSNDFSYEFSGSASIEYGGGGINYNISGGTWYPEYPTSIKLNSDEVSATNSQDPSYSNYSLSDKRVKGNYEDTGGTDEGFYLGSDGLAFHTIELGGSPTTEFSMRNNIVGGSDELKNSWKKWLEIADIVQTTGQSETMVMSQKVTTAEINALKQDISGKVDKVEGYTLLSPTDKAKLDALVIGEGGTEISGEVDATKVKGLGNWITTNRDIVAGLFDTTSATAIKTLETLVGNTTVATQIANAIATERSDLIGTDADTAISNTIKGAKKYADNLNTTMDTRMDAAEAKLEEFSSQIPTKISELTNDSGYLTLSDLPIYNGGVE